MIWVSPLFGLCLHLKAENLMKTIIVLVVLALAFINPSFSQELYEYKRSEEERQRLLEETRAKYKSGPPREERVTYLRDNKTFPGYPLKSIVFVKLQHTFEDHGFIKKSVWEYNKALRLSPASTRFFLKFMSTPTAFSEGEEARSPSAGHFFLISEKGIVQSISMKSSIEYDPSRGYFFRGIVEDEFQSDILTFAYDSVLRNPSKGNVSPENLKLIKDYIRHEFNWPDSGDVMSESGFGAEFYNNGSPKSVGENTDRVYNIQLFGTHHPSKADSLFRVCQKKYKRKCYVLSGFKDRHAYFRLLLRGENTEAATRKLLLKVRKDFPDAFLKKKGE